MKLCFECKRHVRDSSAACPFCGASKSLALPASSNQLSAISRTALIATAIAGASCGQAHEAGTEVDAGDQASVDAGAMVETDAGSVLPENDAGALVEDSGRWAVPAYGEPPLELADAGVDSGPDDDAAIGTDYGIPPQEPE